MDLISPEYAELNRKLHFETDGRYGTGSFRWSEMVCNLREELGAETVLDYGCGRGTLRIGLGNPKWCREYDPAIPGKDVLPQEQSDLVVCTDVLEHVEPERLTNVLDYLWQTAKKGLFVVISLRPSEKTLADGRNAHLLIRDAIWWRAHFERLFKVVSWQVNRHELVAVLRRLHALGEIKVISAVSETIRYENAEKNCKAAKRRLMIQPRHEKRAVIVGFGPSLRDSIQQIAAEQRMGAVIATVSGAHDYLISHGIVPDVHIECDPREHKCFFTRNPDVRVKYWIASCVHPRLVENLLGYDLTLWHVLNGDEDYRILQEIDTNPDAGGFLIQGGGSVGVRAVNVMFTQGYRSFSCYGMDCSFGAGEEDQHAAEHSGKKQQIMLTRVGMTGKWFRTSGTFVMVAKSFIENINYLQGACDHLGEPKPYDGNSIEVLVHGDGLLPAMIAANTTDVALDAGGGDYSKAAAEAA